MGVIGSEVIADPYRCRMDVDGRTTITIDRPLPGGSTIFIGIIPHDKVLPRTHLPSGFESIHLFTRPFKRSRTETKLEIF